MAGILEVAAAKVAKVAKMETAAVASKAGCVDSAAVPEPRATTREKRRPERRRC